MNKTAIKVIKRKMRNGEEEPQLTTENLKTADHDRREMGDTINDWISEYRATSRKEKAFSDGRILAWKLIP